MDIYGVVNELVESGELSDLMINPISQFGTDARPFLGAEILPERPVFELSYEEAEISYQTMIAQASGRYSPPVIVDGSELVGSMQVTLGHSSLSREFTGRDYDAVIRLLRRTGGDAAAREIAAAARVLDFTEEALNRALLTYNEMQRWQAIVNGQVIRIGANKLREVVHYPNVSGHRVAAGGDWTDNAYDPWADILAQVAMLADKGYTVSRIITRRKVVNALMRNINVARRAGGQWVVPIGVGPGQQYAEYSGRMTKEFLQNLASNEGLPPFEIYDARYKKEGVGQLPFLPDGAMVFICETGRDQIVGEDLEPEDQYVLTNTIGYTAVGPIAGEEEPGRQVVVRTPNEIPKRIEMDAAQASIPVLQDPEAFSSISAIVTG